MAWEDIIGDRPTSSVKPKKVRKPKKPKKPKKTVAGLVEVISSRMMPRWYDRGPIYFIKLSGHPDTLVTTAERYQFVQVGDHVTMTIPIDEEGVYEILDGTCFCRKTRTVSIIREGKDIAAELHARAQALSIPWRR